MRILAIMTTFICLSACGLFKKNNGEDPTVIQEEPVAEETPTEPIKTIEVEQVPPAGIKMTYGEVCESFLSTLQSGSIDQISQYTPTVAVARAMSGKETDGKSDKDVQGMIDGLTTRIKDNIDLLRTAASDNNVDLNNLRLRNCLYNESTDPVMVPRVLSVQLSDGVKDYSIPVTVLNYSGKTYVFEILMTTGIFNK